MRTSIISKVEKLQTKLGQIRKFSESQIEREKLKLEMEAARKQAYSDIVSFG